jgi:phage terminase small subunit
MAQKRAASKPKATKGTEPKPQDVEAPRPEKKERQLTPKQQKFADLYIELGNASEAYRQAYDCTNMTAKTIGENAHQLCKHKGIARYLSGIRKSAQEAVAEKYNVTLERLTEELLPIALADAGDFYEWNSGRVTLRDSSTLSRAQRGVVSEVSQTITAGGGSIKVKLHDKLGAIQQLSKLHGLITDKLEISKGFEEMSDDELEAFIAANGKA